ncbi:MAG: hypothetical protein M3443_07740 [Actinomycetota bacterium]|nr:hypothetical protein [Actinomycetota bacterium]
MAALDDVTLSLLDHTARRDAPRLFALYGVFRSRHGPNDDGAFLGWGMEFAEQAAAIMWEPDGGTYVSDSAENILRTHNEIGDARLVWIDDRPTALESDQTAR